MAWSWPVYKQSPDLINKVTNSNIAMAITGVGWRGRGAFRTFLVIPRNGQKLFEWSIVSN